MSHLACPLAIFGHACGVHNSGWTILITSKKIVIQYCSNRHEKELKKGFADSPNPIPIIPVTSQLLPFATGIAVTAKSPKAQKHSYPVDICWPITTLGFFIRRNPIKKSIESIEPLIRWWFRTPLSLNFHGFSSRLDGWTSKEVSEKQLQAVASNPGPSLHDLNRKRSSNNNRQQWERWWFSKIYAVGFYVDHAIVIKPY